MPSGQSKPPKPGFKPYPGIPDGAGGSRTIVAPDPTWWAIL